LFGSEEYVGHHVPQRRGYRRIHRAESVTVQHHDVANVRRIRGRDQRVIQPIDDDSGAHSGLILRVNSRLPATTTSWGIDKVVSRCTINCCVVLMPNSKGTCR